MHLEPEPEIFEELELYIHSERLGNFQNYIQLRCFLIIDIANILYLAVSLEETKNKSFLNLEVMANR